MPGPDPIFGLPTPLLFAHRGGAKEVAESTPLAFEHARAVGADVLELDVNLTADREIVVWHGPGLGNVRLAVEDDLVERRERTEIGEFRWPELDGQAWVGDYRETWSDVSGVPADPARRLLRLEEMLSLFPDDPLNVELKGSFAEQDLAHLVDLLETDPGPERPILIASADHGNLRRLEERLAELSADARERLALGFSAPQVAGALLRSWLPFLGAGEPGRAVQTSYWWPLCPRRLVEKVHREGGAVHAFITPYGPIGGLDEDAGALRVEALREVLGRGVDGVMTDRPSEVRPVLDQAGASP